MAKIVIQSICTIEGDPLDVMGDYANALEDMENAARGYGVGDTRIISVSGMDFSGAPLPGCRCKEKE